MTLERLDKGLDLFGKLLSHVITLCSIAAAGMISWIVLGAMGHEGFVLWALTAIGAVIGGVIVRFVLMILSHLSSF